MQLAVGTYDWAKLPAELWRTISAFLPANEITCSLRPVCKTTWQALEKHTRVLLSRPVPAEVFSSRWGSEDATRSMTLKQRRTALCLVASSGHLENFKLLYKHAACTLTGDVAAAAASAGHVPVAQWLWDNGGRDSHAAYHAAITAGRVEVCRWLRSMSEPVGIYEVQQAATTAYSEQLPTADWLAGLGVPPDVHAVAAATSAGRTDVAFGLLQRNPKLRRAVWSAVIGLVPDPQLLMGERYQTPPPPPPPAADQPPAGDDGGFVPWPEAGQEEEAWGGAGGWGAAGDWGGAGGWGAAGRWGGAGGWGGGGAGGWEGADGEPGYADEPMWGMSGPDSIPLPEQLLVSAEDWAPLLRLHALGVAAVRLFPGAMQSAVEEGAAVAAAAAAWPGPEWREVVAWVVRLLSRGRVLLDAGGGAAAGDGAAGVAVDWGRDQHLLGPGAGMAAVGCPDAAARLVWLRSRGFATPTSYAAREAARRGDAAAVAVLLRWGVMADDGMAMVAAEQGQLDVLRLLHHEGKGVLPQDILHWAAAGGHLPVVRWVCLEAVGQEQARQLLGVERLLEAAAGSCSMELWEWLVGRGCPLGGQVLARAAGRASAEQVEWLLERGCTFGVSGGVHGALRGVPLACTDLCR